MLSTSLSRGFGQLVTVCTCFLLLCAIVTDAQSVPFTRGKTIAANSRARPVEDTLRIAHVTQVLGLAYPFSLPRLEFFKDGGSRSGTFVDYKGDSVQWGWGFGPADSVAGQLWLGAYAYDRPGATWTEPGSEREEAMVAAMRLYVDTYVRPDQQDSLLATPGYYLYRLSVEQRRAKELLHIARRVEARAKKLK